MSNIYLDVNRDTTGNTINVDKYNSARKNKNPWLVWYHASWCGHCIAMKDSWDEFVSKNSNNVNIAKIEDSVVNLVKKEKELYGFPTIRFINNGNVIEYHGDRSADSLLSFVEENMIPLNSKKSPGKSPRKSPRKNNKKTKKQKKTKKGKESKKNKSSKRSINNKTGGGILDSIESKLQILENMMGNYSFE